MSARGAARRAAAPALASLGIPVVRPLEEGVEALVPVVREFIASEAQGVRIAGASSAVEDFALTRPYAIAGQDPIASVGNVVVRIEARRRPRRARRRFSGRARHRRDARGLPRGHRDRAPRLARRARRRGRCRALPRGGRAHGRDARGARRDRHRAPRPAGAAPRRAARRDAGPGARRAADVDHDRHQVGRRDAGGGRGVRRRADFRVLKVKIGDALDVDLERLRAAARDAVGARRHHPRRREHRLHRRGDGAVLRAHRAPRRSSSSSSRCRAKPSARSAR